MEARRIKIVYAASERGGRQCLSRIGIAFIGADGALNIKLDALPVSGELRIIDYSPIDPGRGASRTAASEPAAPPA